MFMPTSDEGMEMSIEQMCDLVDSFASSTETPKEIPCVFWKRLFNDTTIQQNFAKCLIFKYISFTYGLGHKPLREAMRMIKNISSTEKSTVSSLKPQQVTATRHGSLVLDLSPLKRGRALTNPGRRKSGDPKAAMKISPAPPESSTPPGKIKRKSSEGVEEGISFLQTGLSVEDRQTITRLRELLYTIAFVANSCDLHKWDFNKMRDVFLVWNKARSWERAASIFETAIMKRFSRPPEIFDDVEKWCHDFSEILLSFNKETEWENTSSLHDETVGNSIKYWILRFKTQHLSSSTTAVVDAIIQLLEKVHANYEETKIAALLHVFCEAVILAPYVPLATLQKAYSSFQLLYMLPVTISAAVKEVLDLIQAEMKSPGYFRRAIYFQEQETKNLSQKLSVNFSSAHVFVDKRSKEWETLESALTRISTRSKVSSDKTEEDQKKVVVEQIYKSVFGPENLDLLTLQQALQNCSTTRLSTTCAEALEIMEQSAAMESTDAAQDFIRKQLEALSNKLQEEQDVTEDVNHAEDESNERSTPNIILSKSVSGSSSAPALVIAPPRVQSYLSRTISSASVLSQSESTSTSSSQTERYGTNEMDYPRMEIKCFDRDQIADEIFEMVRSTAKAFLQQKRSGSSAHQRNREKRRSGFRSSGEMRDSGLIEDYSEERNKKESDSLHLLAPNNKEIEDQTKEFWENFSEKGFSQNGKRESENLDDLIKSFRLSIVSNESVDHNEQATTPTQSKNTSNHNHSQNTNHPLKKPPTSTAFTQSKSASTSNADDPATKEHKPRQRKSKYNIKTLGRKGIKMMRGIRRTPSNRIVNIQRSPSPDDLPPATFRILAEHQESTSTEEENSQIQQTSSAASLSTLPSHHNTIFDTIATSRWRTSSLPLKGSLRGLKKSMNRRHIKDIFASTGDVGKDTKNDTSTSSDSANNLQVGARNLSTSSENVYLAAPNRFSFDPGHISTSRSAEALHVQPHEALQLTINAEDSIRRRNIRKLSSDTLKVFVENDESRNRMDSGIVPDKNDSRLRSSPGPGGNSGEDSSEENGVAGVKFARKQAVRRNLISRSSLSQPPARTVRKKVLKLAFVGNDKTVSDVARAYYELRRRQATRAPLLQHIDLRMYYIPVGENAFDDEAKATQNGSSTFDLEIGEMLGSIDPWYRYTVTMATNNVVRVIPAINKDDIACENADENKPSSQRWDTIDQTPENVLASGISGYLRFAIRTAYIPIFKVTMRSSSDDVITEVFCCRAEIGYVAYKQAIAAGRFGKVGKLVDISDDSGPPAAYTSFTYSKYGISGSFVSEQTLPDKHYYRIRIAPIALSNSDCRDQVRFPGADGLHITALDNDKREKLIKRALQKGNAVEEDYTEQYGTKFNVNEAKIEVVRPVQGTFTVSLDHNLIYTNIKSFEVSRCVTPGYHKETTRKMHFPRYSKHLLSLPLKIFWPNSVTA
ncbi:unnamed protein product [Clavelina lepadiformis]|uniref:Uncharacterized protein n=1 Tax=Clavelina lepadiformis TaxID=159417 RepID=A0ABP0FF79_CLALP